MRDRVDVMMCGHPWSDYELRPSPVRRGLGVFRSTDPAPLRMFDAGKRVGGYRPCVRCRVCREQYDRGLASYAEDFMGVTWFEVNEHAWLMFSVGWSVLACRAVLDHRYDAARHNDRSYASPAPWNEWDHYAGCWVCNHCGAAAGYQRHNPLCYWSKP